MERATEASYGSDTTAAQAEDTPLSVAERMLGLPRTDVPGGGRTSHDTRCGAMAASSSAARLARLEETVRELAAQLTSNSRELELWTRLDELAGHNRRLKQSLQRRQAMNQRLRESIRQRTARADAQDPTKWSADQLREFLTSRSVPFDSASEHPALLAAAQASIEARPLRATTENEISPPRGTELRPGVLGDPQQHPLDARSSIDMMRAVAALLGGGLDENPGGQHLPHRAPGTHPLPRPSGTSDAPTISEGIPPMMPMMPMMPMAFRTSLPPPPPGSGAASQQSAARGSGSTASHPAPSSQDAQGQPPLRAGTVGGLPHPFATAAAVQRPGQGAQGDPFMDGLVDWAAANLGNTVRIITLGGGGAGQLLHQAVAPAPAGLTAEQFDSIPSETWSATVAEAAAGADASCAICQSAYSDGDLVSVMPLCKHRFHTECVRPWLRDRASTCPCCRQSALSSDTPAAPPTTVAAAEPAVAEETGDSDDALLRSPTVD